MTGDTDTARREYSSAFHRVLLLPHAFNKSVTYNFLILTSYPDALFFLYLQRTINPI